MQQKKVKHLDQFRPNVLPQLSRTVPEKISVGAQRKNQQDDSYNREKLLEILSQTQSGIAKDRPDVMKQMEKKRLENVAFRLKREKQMFVLDDSVDIFALPGKPEQAGLLSPEHRRSKSRSGRKSRVTDALYESSSPDLKQKGADQFTAGDFGFLNDSLGIAHSLKLTVDIDVLSQSNDFLSPPAMAAGDPQTSTKRSATQSQKMNSVTSNNTSDLDQIAGILQGISTGGDALNFFARYGSETPVKFVHLVQVDDPKTFR
jgi:hypothetical protein